MSPSDCKIDFDREAGLQERVGLRGGPVGSGPLYELVRQVMDMPVAKRSDMSITVKPLGPEGTFSWLEIEQIEEIYQRP